MDGGGGVVIAIGRENGRQRGLVGGAQFPDLQRVVATVPRWAWRNISVHGCPVCAQTHSQQLGSEESEMGKDMVVVWSDRPTSTKQQAICLFVGE